MARWSAPVPTRFGFGLDSGREERGADWRGQIRGDERHMDALSDSLTVGLLRELGTVRPMGPPARGASARPRFPHSKPSSLVSDCIDVAPGIRRTPHTPCYLPRFDICSRHRPGCGRGRVGRRCGGLPLAHLPCCITQPWTGAQRQPFYCPQLEPSGALRYRYLAASDPATAGQATL